MVLYQAFFSTSAATAGDYLDLADRGAAVTPWSDGDCPDNAICDIALPPPLPRDRADSLIASLLVGRVDPGAIDHTYAYGSDADTFQIIVELPDGTRLDLSFGCDDRTSSTGNVLPDGAFSDAEFDRLWPDGESFEDRVRGIFG